MTLWEKLTQWLGIDQKPSPKKNTHAPQIILNRAKTYKRLGKYGEALAELEQAAAIINAESDPATAIAIDLHRADIFVLQSQWQPAHALLIQLKKEAERLNFPAPLAYILIALGVWHQEQDDWEAAREHYENSLEPAKESKSLGAEGRAQGHLADTYLHEGNIGYAVHLLEQAIPKLDASGDTELASYFVGLLGKAKVKMGRPDQGRHLLERALSLAQKMQLTRYSLMWKQALAVRDMAEGHDDIAKDRLSDILKHPSTPEDREDHLKIVCWLSKTWLRLVNAENSLKFAQQAVALSAEDDEPSDLRWLAQVALGISLRATGQYTEALQQLEPALEPYQTLQLTDADYTMNDLLRNLATAQMETGDYDAAESTLERALTQIESLDMPLEKGHIYRDRGFIHLRKVELEEALKIWVTALRVYESQYEYAAAARLYCDVANTRRYLGQGRRAMKDYSQALTLLSSVNNPTTRGIILANAAVAYAEQGDAETAESFFSEAIMIAKTDKDALAESTRRGNYGWYLMTTGWPERGLAVLEQALQQSEANGFKLQAAVQLNNMGLVRSATEHYEKSLNLHQQALARLASLKSPDWTAMVKANIGHTLIALGQLDEAETMLSEALETGRALHFVELIIHALNGQVKLALERDTVEPVDDYLNEAIKLAKRGQNNRLLAESMLLRSRYHARMGQQRQAAADWEKALSLKGMLRRTIDKSRPTWLTDAAMDDSPEQT